MFDERYKYWLVNKSLYIDLYLDGGPLESDVKFLEIRGLDRIFMIHKILNLTDRHVATIPLNDEATLSLFRSPLALGVTSDDILRCTGALGLGIFDNLDWDTVLDYAQVKSLEDLKKVRTINFSNSYKYDTIVEFLKEEKITYKNICEEEAYVEVLWAYVLGFYKLYYPLAFYKTYLEENLFYLNLDIDLTNILKIRKRLFELNDVNLTSLKVYKKRFQDLEEEALLMCFLEIRERGIKIEIKKAELDVYYQVEIDNEQNKLIIIVNEVK